MAENTDYRSSVTEFSDNCTLAIGRIVTLFNEALETILMSSGSLCETANLEYKYLIETQYAQLIDEIKQGVMLYLDCNMELFQCFSAAEVDFTLLHYNEQIQKAIAALSKSETQGIYVSNTEIESKPDIKNNTEISDNLGEEEQTACTSEHALPEEQTLPGDEAFLEDVKPVIPDDISEETEEIEEAEETSLSDVSSAEESMAVSKRKRKDGASSVNVKKAKKVGIKGPKRKKKAKCDICEEWVENKTRLKEHMKSHFTCSHCNKGFTSQEALDRHTAIHTKPFVCPTCGVGFARDYALRAHQNIHTGETPYECQICHKGYRERHLLTDHMRYHRPKVTCPYCPLKLTKRSNLFRHIEVKHPGYKNIDERKKTHICPVCQAGFSYLTSFNAHMLKNHPDTVAEKRLNFKCHTCYARFKSKDILAVHKRSCVKQVCECDVCGKKYNNKILLQNHKRYHAKKDLYCPHCSKRFVKSYDLKTHIMRVHKNERPIKCEYCFKGFVTNYELGKHLVTHTGVSDFRCHICNKYFN